MLKLRHIASITGIIGLLIGAATGVVGGYIGSRMDMTTLTGRLNEHELRLNGLDKTLELYHREQLDYQTEMRAAVAHAVDILTDVRLQITRGHRG